MYAADFSNCLPLSEGIADDSGLMSISVAGTSLLVLAAAIGNTRRILIKRSWTEPTTLWACLIQRSGALKSPALAKMLEPVNRLEMDLKREYDRQLEEYEWRMEEHEKLSKAQKADAEVPAKPSQKRIRVGDTTVESIAVLHEENARGLLLARDELADWLGSFDRYARGEADLQAWLELYEGRLAQIDRKSSEKKALYVAYPAVSVVGTIQPGTLTRRLEPKHFESGFVQRILLAHPPEQRRRLTTADVMPDVEAAYVRLVRTLYEIPFEGEPRALPMTGDAFRRFQAFYDANAEMMDALPDGNLRSALSKLEALAARFSLVFELCDDPDAERVTEASVERGVTVAEWFRYELARIYLRDEFESCTLSKDEKLVRELPEEFGWQEVSEVWGVKRRAAFKTLKRLQDQNLISEVHHGTYSARDVHRALVHFVHYGGDGAASSSTLNPEPVEEAPAA